MTSTLRMSPSPSKSLNLPLEGTPLHGLPVDIVISYLGNLQIMQIILNNQKVVFEKSKTLEKAKKIEALVTKYGISSIVDGNPKQQLLQVLALKLNYFLGADQLLITTVDQPHFVCPENLNILLKNANTIRKIKFASSYINYSNLQEVVKILYLVGTRQITNICTDNLLNLNAKQVSQAFARLYPHVMEEGPEYEGESEENYYKRVANLFQGTLHFKTFTTLELIIAITPFKGIVMFNFGKQGGRFFKVDHQLISSAGKEMLKMNGEFSSDEKKLFEEVRKQMNKYTQEFTVINKSDLVKRDPSLKKLTPAQLRKKTFLGQEALFVEVLQKQYAGDQCFMVPDMTKPNVLVFALNFLRKDTHFDQSL